jgi:pyruvate formate-lyase activating enzyme-like uncharacterized protein
MARKHSHVRASDILKVAEEKMDRALLACSQEKADSELRKRLIDDLKKATNEFLELREELCQRITRMGRKPCARLATNTPPPHPGQAFCL